MSKVSLNSTVTVNYTGRLEDGSIFDSSLNEGREPLKATLGQGQLIPGFSEHHTGKAFDIFSTEESWWDAKPEVKKWVADNASNYGFRVTYKTPGTLRVAEPWHLYYTK